MAFVLQDTLYNLPAEQLSILYCRTLCTTCLLRLMLWAGSRKALPKNSMRMSQPSRHSRHLHPSRHSRHLRLSRHSRFAPQQHILAPQQAATSQQAQQATSSSMSAKLAKTLPGVSAVTLNPNTGRKTTTGNREAVASSTEGINQDGNMCAIESSRVTFQLPDPFTARPRIRPSQSHFPGIAGALAAEMLSWQHDMRLRYLPAPVISNRLQVQSPAKLSSYKCIARTCSKEDVCTLVRSYQECPNLICWHAPTVRTDRG